MKYNSVFIEIKNPSITRLLPIIDVLKKQDCQFEIVEGFSPNSLNAFNEYDYSKRLGKKGNTILQLLAEGKTYEDIAQYLEISIDGVRYYIKKIFKTLGVNNGRDAVRIFLTQIKHQNLEIS